MISAIIPVYNHSRFVAEAIQSCLLCPEVTEIVIADDGSTDNSREIVAYFAGRFPGYIRDLTEKPPKNIGAHERINHLCQAAKGDWLAILNSDDRFEPGRFRNFDRFVQYTGADVVFGNCSIVNDDNRTIGYKYPLFDAEYAFPKEFSLKAILRENDWLKALMNQNIIATTSNLVIRRSFFEKLGGFAAYRYVHDWDFMLRATLVGKLRYNPNMWVNYRVHQGNTISENARRVRDEVQTVFSKILSSPEFGDAELDINDRDEFDLALAGNQYLHGASSSIALVLREEPGHPEIIRALKAVPNMVHVPQLADVPEGCSVVYAPTSAEVILQNHELQNLSLSCATIESDIHLCSSKLDDPDKIQGGSLRDFAFVGRHAFSSVISQTMPPGMYASGNVMRLPREDSEGPSRTLKAYFSRLDCRQTGSRFELRAPGAPVSQTKLKFSHPTIEFDPLRSPVAVEDQRPRVFVFPAFVAVGGAENIMLEVMKQLKDKYSFIIVCTEKLSAAQGSWAHRALDHADALYELAEICAPEELLLGLATLRRAYQPSLIYITNGSMWQMKHAWRIRKLFRETAIVDQQVYDAKVGWVEWFNHPGVRSADRFIAVNKRIESHFVSDLGLDPKLVDLIHHPIDSARLLKNLPAIRDQDSREKFGLDAGKPVVAFVGRMTDQKRPWLFLDLAERAKAAGEQIQFVMVGQGPLSETVSERIIRDQLDNVIRVPNVKLIEELYAVTDLLVITSEYEGLPLAMLEAMSSGVPVFATDVGDIGLMLAKYTKEKVLPVDTTPDKLFELFRSAMKQLPERKQRARAAAERVSRDFSGEEVSKKYDATFRSAMTPYENARAY